MTHPPTSPPPAGVPVLAAGEEFRVTEDIPGDVRLCRIRVAEDERVPEGSMIVARPTLGRGHYSVHGAPDALLGCVTRVIPVDPPEEGQS